MKNQQQYIIEELFLTFVMGIPTEADFKYYLTLLNRGPWRTKGTLLKLDNYFQVNYFKFRDNAKTVLTNSSKTLEELDKIYFKKYELRDLLQEIKQKFFSDNCNLSIKSSIKCKINLMFENFNIIEEIPNELLLYMFIFGKFNVKSLTEQRKTNLVNLLTTVIKSPQINNKHLEMGIELELKEISFEKIISKLQDNDYKKYVLIINLVELMTKPIQDKKIFQKLKEINKLLDEFNCNERNILIKVILYCYNIENSPNSTVTVFTKKTDDFEVLGFQKKTIYSVLFNLFYKDDSKINLKTMLIEWFITNIIKSNLDVHYIEDNSRQTIIKILIESTREFNTAFLSNIMPKLFIQIVNISNKSQLIQIYQKWKKLINEILSSNKFPQEMKFTSFYLKLIYKQFKREIFKNLEFNSEQKNTHSDIYLVFTLLHNEIFEKIQSVDVIKDIINQLQENKKINLSQKNLPEFEQQQFSYLSYRSYFGNNDYNKNILHYSKLSYSIIPNKFNNSTHEYFEKIHYYKDYNILFIEILQSDIPDFQENYFLKQVEVHTTKKELKFSLQGFFIINQNQQKDVILFEKTSKRWYSISEGTWDTQLTFQKDLQLISVVYFKRNKYYQEFQTPFEILNDVHCLSGEYWDIFKKILNMNIFLIEMDLDFYIRSFSLNELQNLKTLISMFKEFNEKAKYLILKIVMVTRKQLYDETEIENLVKPYFLEDINIFYPLLTNYLNHKIQKKNEFILLKIKWNIYYYIKHIHTIDNVSNQLAFLLTLCYFWKKIKEWKKDLKQFSFIEESYFQQLDQLNNDLLLDSQIRNFITFWKNTELRMIDDYKLKLLSELIITSQIKQNFKDHLIYFLQENKLLISVTNNKEDKDIELFYTIFYSHYLLKFQSKTQYFDELIEICFEINKETLQFSDFQRKLLTNYTNVISTLLSNRKTEKLYEKIKYISKFILVENGLQEWFIILLLKLSEMKNEMFHKIIQPILLSMFNYSKSDKHKYLQYTIIYYFQRLKVEAHKQEIEQINNLTEFIELYGGKRSKETPKETDKNDSFIQTNSPEPNKETKETKISIENDLKYLEPILNENCWLFHEIKIQNEGISYTIIYPQKKTDNVNSDPDTKYIYYIPKNQIQKIIYSNNTYKLRGFLIYNYNSNKRYLLIQNKYDQTLFSVDDKTWKNSMQKYIKDKDNHTIIAIYFLSQKVQTLSFKYLEKKQEKTIKMTNDLKILNNSVEWLKKNVPTKVQKHQKILENLFGTFEIEEFTVD